MMLEVKPLPIDDFEILCLWFILLNQSMIEAFEQILLHYKSSITELNDSLYDTLN